MLKRNSFKVHSNTRLHWQLALETRTGRPNEWFWKFFWTVSLKAHDWSSWTLNECNLCWKIVKYRILSEVCMINSTYCFTSDVMYKKYKRLVYTPPDLLARICKVNLSNAKKFCLICFPRICFRALIYSCDQEPLWLLNLIEDVCYFLGVHRRLSTQCKMFHSKIT